MTIWDVLSAVRRQWLLALAGIITTAAGVYAAGTTPGVYFQEANVVFFAPDLSGRANTYQLPPVVAAAGLVGRQVSARPQGPLPVTTTVTIVDLGIREGALARLPNTNQYNQWANSFSQPMLNVQVVGDTPERVRARMTVTVSEIRRALRQGQLAEGARPDQLIGTVVNPPAPPVLYRQGSSSRAAAAALVLGMGLTLTLVVMADRWRGRRGGVRRRWSLYARRAR
jgi:hypothetical protein